MHMSDGSAEESWAQYLKRMTDRAGWSVARLARESGIHRSTIFRWIGGGRGVTVASVRSIAAALGDDVADALRAAGNVVDQEERDEEVQLILDAPWSEEKKVRMIDRLYRLREEDKQRRIATMRLLLDDADQGRDAG